MRDPFGVRIAAEQTFLNEFVSDTMPSPGSRLAHWLQEIVLPAPYNCRPIELPCPVRSCSIDTEESPETDGIFLCKALRAVFAALLWHHGIVADAMSCAAHLRFISETRDLPLQFEQLSKLWTTMALRIMV